MMAIETQQQQFQSQAATSDKIVDTFFEVGEPSAPPLATANHPSTSSSPRFLNLKKKGSTEEKRAVG